MSIVTTLCKERLHCYCARSEQGPRLWKSFSRRSVPQVLHEPYSYVFLASKMAQRCEFRNLYFVLSSALRVLGELLINSLL